MRPDWWTRWLRLTIAGLVAVALVVGPPGSGSGAEAHEPAGLERAIDAKERHATGLLIRSGVVGVGVGVNDAGEPVVRVLVVHDRVAGVPQQVDGVPVETVVTGLITARCGSTTDDCDPAPLGVSIGHPGITAGTLGALVTDGTNVFILSNNHVLANSNKAAIGDSALQPGPFDGGTDPGDSIGTLHQFVPLNFNSGANSVDAAIALTNESVTTNGTLSSLPGSYGTPTTTPIGATVNMPVQKCGRTTGCTQGTVTEISLDVSVCYETAGPFRCKTSALFENQIAISDGSFSAGGDSGSLIVDTAGDPDPVGLLFAGSSTRTIANHIGDVLGSLNVTMYDGNLAANTAPTITSTPNTGPVNEGTNYSYDVDATDTESHAITYQLQSAPGAMTISDTTGTITWSPADTDAGQHQVTVRATDSLGAFDEQSYAIDVAEALNATPAVSISSPLNGTTIAPGDPVSLTATATDSEDGDIANDLTWVSDFDGDLGSGANTITTALTTIGIHTVTASVSDSGSATRSDTVTVEVVQPGNTTVTLTDLGSLNQGRTWLGRVEIGFTSADAVVWTWSTGGSATCTTTPCAVDTGDLRKNIGSATLSIQVIEGGAPLDPVDFTGPSQIVVNKP